MFEFNIGNIEYKGVFDYVEEIPVIENSYSVIKKNSVVGVNNFGSCGQSILESYELIFFADCNLQLDFTAEIMRLIKPLGQIDTSTSNKLSIIKRLPLYDEDTDVELKARIKNQYICSIDFSINRICTDSCGFPTQSYGCNGYASTGGSGNNTTTWGSIEGDINNQTDLALALETLTSDLEELSEEVDDLFVISVSL